MDHGIDQVPTAAPMNRVGVNMPPTAPEPTVAAVLRIFAAKIASNSHPPRLPLRWC